MLYFYVCGSHQFVNWLYSFCFLLLDWTEEKEALKRKGKGKGRGKGKAPKAKGRGKTAKPKGGRGRGKGVKRKKMAAQVKEEEQSDDDLDLSQPASSSKGPPRKSLRKQLSLDEDDKSKESSQEVHWAWQNQDWFKLNVFKLFNNRSFVF